jgi:GNAT superfamily N-acetyltransferase
MNWSSESNASARSVARCRHAVFWVESELVRTRHSIRTMADAGLSKDGFEDSRVRISVADPADTAGLADCLAVSYRDNPLFGWMFAEELYHALLRDIFTGLLDSAIIQRRAYGTEGHYGAAIWSAPRAQSAPQDGPNATNDSDPDLETSAGRRQAALAVLSAHRPREPHMYLTAVGVLPDQRRRGLASGLLAPVLEECATAGIDAYLENSDPRNTRFYQGVGFEVLGDLPMPFGAPPVARMIRRARSRPQR